MTEPASFKDRVMQVLLEIQAAERQPKVNDGELAALASLDQKAARHREVLGIPEPEGDE